MRKSKKAFTIVELVIVIAVIAILAAVLIPTFVNVTKSAKQSSDISAVRNMNTYLAVEDATKGNMTLKDVHTVLAENGVDGEHYTPLYSGRYFFYDQDENRIVYTEYDSESNTYKVIFPEGMEQGNHKWYSLNGSIDTSTATIALPSGSPTAGAIELEVKNAADFVKAAEYVSTYASELKNISLTLTDNIDLMGADANFTSDTNEALNVTINGGGYTLSGLWISDNHTRVGWSGAAGTKIPIYGAAMFNGVSSLTVKNITLENACIGSYNVSQAAIFASLVYDASVFENVTVKNSTVYGSRKNGVLVGYSQGTVDLTNVTLTGNSVYAFEGESGVLFGVASHDGADFITVDGLTMTDNTIAFAEDAPTFKITDATEYTEGVGLTTGGLIFKTMPLNNEFGYDKDDPETVRFGLAAVCFIGNHGNNLMASPYKKGSITFTYNGTAYELRMACAVNSIEDLTKPLTSGEYFFDVA